MYYLEHLVQEIDLNRDVSRVADRGDAKAKGTQENASNREMSADRFIKNTYLYNCLLQCNISLEMVEAYQGIVKQHITQTQQ